VRADEYRRAADNLGRFLVAFDQLIENCERWQPGLASGFEQLCPRPDRRQEAARLMDEVSSLAGPAAQAFEISGMGMDYKPSGTWQRQRVNPALVWSTIFNEQPMLDPPLMRVIGRQALGELESKYAEQAARQKGLIGAVAWFLTLAPRVREAAGLPAHSASGFAVTWITAIVQGVIVAVVGGALVYPFVNALGWAP
jgi:hypothetical protein